MNKLLYNAPITRKNPALIGFLLDTSGSMSNRVMFNNEDKSKAEVLSIIVNQTIKELISRCRKFSGYYDYFEFIALGYGCDEVTNLLEDVLGKCDSDIETYKISDFVGNYVEHISLVKAIKCDENRFEYISSKVPLYINPKSDGKTPMCKAFNVAYDTISKWTKANPNSFPPIIINITDGEATDATGEEMIVASNRLQSIKTSNGNLLLLNIHIGSYDDIGNVKFPRAEYELPSVSYVTDLYHMSSIFPTSMLPTLQNYKKVNTLSELSKCRMMSFNSSITTILEALNIGTISITNFI